MEKSEAIQWRLDVMADGWDSKPMYQHEPEECAAKLTNSGWIAHVIAREGYVDVAVWGPDGLAVDPPYIYSMDRLVEGLESCNICGAKHVHTQRYSFAGRCCADCIEDARAEHEKPGWYN